jgi:DnaJ-domain-containing protein 1
MSLPTILVVAGCLLATGLVWWPRRRKRKTQHEPEVEELLDEVRLGLGPRWDPYRPEDAFAHRIRMARERAAEFRQRQDYYTILGVQPGASDAEIESAFRSRVIAVHPDRFVGDPSAQKQAEVAMRQLTKAVSVLRDPLARARYDAGRLPDR